MAAVMKLHGTPYNQIKMLKDSKQNQEIGWKEMVEYLDKIYKSRTKELEKRKKLRELRQGSGKVEVYTDEFTYIISSLNNMTEIAKIDAYCNGINERAAQKIYEASPETLETAIHIAINAEGRESNSRSLMAVGREINGYNNSREYSNNNNNYQKSNQQYNSKKML